MEVVPRWGPRHDLRLAPRFVAADVQNILDVLQQEVARYFVLNWDVNSGRRHDLRLAARFVAADVQNILDVLQQEVARYVVLNRDVNSGPRTKTYFDMRSEQSWEDTGKAPAGIRLTGMAGFSDQAHFAEADWYRREVVHAIPPERQLTCMEHVLHDIWKQDPEWRRTFLYGGPDDGPFVYDLVHGVQVRGLSGQLVGMKAMPERAVPG
mmetsp:Transcript_68350/g.183967  ORF Transcript_68350/g.183967 Transcript_68350/m.183967 type:complete len:209 (-) Transcript_68350:98-724(-)